MRNSFYAILFIASTLIFAAILYVIYNYNSDLESQVAKKDEIIENFETTDSLNQSLLKEYASKIDNYVDNCTFNINGKEITAQEVVRIVNKEFRNNQLYRDSLDYYKKRTKTLDDLYKAEYNKQLNLNSESYKSQYQRLIDEHIDSLNIYRFMVKLAKKHYGLEFKVKKEKNTLSAEWGGKMIDSAIVLFPYYKHRLSKDGDEWTIETDKEFRRIKRRSEKQ